MADKQSGGWSVKSMWKGEGEEDKRSPQEMFWDRFDSVMLVIMRFYFIIMIICIVVAVALLIIGYKALPIATAKMM